MAKKTLSGELALAVTALPAPTAALAGLTVQLTSDGKPYWCDGSSWYSLAPGSAMPAGSTGAVQFNNAGSLGGAAAVGIDSDELVLIDGAVTTVAPTNAASAKMVGRAKANRVYPSFITSRDVEVQQLQPHIAEGHLFLWMPGSNNAVPGILGCAAMTATSSASGTTVATTNSRTRMKRYSYASTATAGNIAGHYSTRADWTMGDGTRFGGFYLKYRFAVGDATLQSVAQSFVGISSSVAAPTNVSPATLTNCIGMGHAPGATSWSIYFGGSTAQTPVALGANFPIDTTTAYELTLYASPKEVGKINWHVKNLATGNEISGTVGDGTAAKAPLSTTLLSPRAWRSNNTAAASVVLDIGILYIESDF